MLNIFSECTSLTSITISNNVTEIKELTFYNCHRLTSVIIPNSITNIGHMAFYNCNSMKSITIPNSVTTIAESAFENCSGLKSITIPNSVTWIGYRAFSACKGLTSVTIPNSVTRIVDFAFSSCSDLTDVYCYIKDLSCVEFAFGIFSNSYLEYTTLHVPNASLETYKMKKPWSEFGKIVPLESSDDYESVSDEKIEAIRESVKFKIEPESDNEESVSDNNNSTLADINDDSDVFGAVDEMPVFPGGPQALFEYLSKSIRYPVDAEENGAQGKVICSFVIEQDGSISNVNVVKSVYPSLDKEAIRIIKAMPKWIPGKLNGKAVRTKYTTPVTFRL